MPAIHPPPAPSQAHRISATDASFVFSLVVIPVSAPQQAQPVAMGLGIFRLRSSCRTGCRKWHYVHSLRRIRGIWCGPGKLPHQEAPLLRIAYPGSSCCICCRKWCFPHFQCHRKGISCCIHLLNVRFLYTRRHQITNHRERAVGLGIAERVGIGHIQYAIVG